METKYKAILMDPPWSFRVWSEETGLDRSAEKHYSTMSAKDMRQINLQSIMDKDCAVFMWVTWPTIQTAFDLAEMWGLEYKTCAFLWAKQNKISDSWFWGMGYWTRANTEPCLLFTRGKPKRKAKNVHQLIVSKIGRHSQKPDMVYNKIESLVDGPYIELFARQSRPGWDAIGNEINGKNILEELAWDRNNMIGPKGTN